MVAPLPKSKEFGDKLIDILSSERVLSQMELHRWIREIKSLKDPAEESYLLALAYAGGGDKDKAILHFDKSLYSDEDGVSASNYLAFIVNVGDANDYVEVSSKLADMYVSRELYGAAFYMHMHCGKIEKAIEYGRKFIKVSPNGEDEVMQRNIAYFTSALPDFKERSSLSDAKFELITSSMASVMRKHKASSDAYRFFNISEESVNAYVISLGNKSIDEIAEMNYELAFELAEHDELLGTNVSAWFEKGPSAGDAAEADVDDLEGKKCP